MIHFSLLCKGIRVNNKLFVIILIFGGKKLPELARGLALGLKEFKKASKDIKDEVESATKEVEESTEDLK